MKTLLLSMLLACGGGDGDDSAGDDSAGDDSAGDGGSAADGGTASDGGSASDGGTSADLNGDLPAKALPAPEFVATNRDGTGRDREDLLGHPTVMWFYPLAGTAG